MRVSFFFKTATTLNHTILPLIRGTFPQLTPHR
jgi:hypothetical protein